MVRPELVFSLLTYFNFPFTVQFLRSAHMMGLVTWCELLQNLVAGTNFSPWLSQFEFVGLVAATKFWSLRVDLAAKMASSHDATSPCDLLHGIVAGTSPIVCADLYCSISKTN